jgi:hypothetical protein
MREISTNRRNLLKAGGVAVLGGMAGGCTTATGVNPAVPMAAKLIQDPSQTNATPVGPGTAPPGPAADVKPTYIAKSIIVWVFPKLVNSMSAVVAAVPGPDTTDSSHANVRR